MHERIVVHTGSGREVGVDHVYWASYVEAQLAPHRSAPKAAARLLRCCCERLVLPEVALGEACRLLDELIARAIVCTRGANRVERGPACHSHACHCQRPRLRRLGGFSVAPDRADVNLAHRSSAAWTVNRSETATAFSTLVPVPFAGVSEVAS